MPSPVLVDHGTPVVSSRQWTTGLSPNAAGNGWNYIAQSLTSGQPAEWVVIKNLTDVPSEHAAIVTDEAAYYANITFHWDNPSGSNRQLRAPNGRIFWPLFGNHTAYYDPVDEDVTLIGPFIESPPVDPHASTIPYSASFDVAGLLYFATQESQHRPSCVVVTDPTTTPPTQTVLGYVGSGSNAYTTYGYYLAPDTATATKYVYVAYGQDPWQLWALEITTGTATKLAEVPASGRISFKNIANQGWVATLHTTSGDTQVWCLDGATYPYTVGVPPPSGLARNVTPALNSLATAPSLDTAGGAGVVGWRPHGSTGAYTYINYPVNHATPQPLEALVNTPTGILGNATQYQGFFSVDDASGDVLWYGVQGGVLDISQGPRIGVPSSSPSVLYLAGYPDGVLYTYNPAQPWQAASAPAINPLLLGYYGPSGVQKAGIKYATCFAWSASAGASGRLYCGGTRERSGTGAGIGYWDATTNTIAGTFAAPLDTVQPNALVSLDAHGWIVMSTRTLSGSGTATIYVLDQALNIVSTQTPIAMANLGMIFPTSDPDVVCGVYQAGAFMGLYRHNVVTNTLLSNVVTAYAGSVSPDLPALPPLTVNQADGAVWVAVGNTVVRVNPDTLAVSSELDVTSIAPVSCMAFHGTNLYLASSANLWSARFQQAAYVLDAEAGAYDIVGFAVTFEIGATNVLNAEAGAYAITGFPVVFSTSFEMLAEHGTYIISGNGVRMFTSSPELFFDLPTIETQRATQTIYADSPFVIQKRIPPVEVDAENTEDENDE